MIISRVDFRRIRSDRAHVKIVTSVETAFISQKARSLASEPRTMNWPVTIVASVADFHVRNGQICHSLKLLETLFSLCTEIKI